MAGGGGGEARREKRRAGAQDYHLAAQPTSDFSKGFSKSGPTSTDHSHNCTAVTLEMAIFDSDIMVQHYKGKGRHHLIDADHGKVHTRNRVEVG